MARPAGFHCADFPNSNRLLRNGQPCVLLVTRNVKHAIFVPQRAAFNNYEKWYVYVIDSDNVAHRREITVLEEMANGYIVGSGVSAGDKIIFDGVLVTVDGAKVEYKPATAEKPISNLPGIDQPDAMQSELDQPASTP